MKSVFVVESHNCFRESLADMLDLEPDLRVIGQAGSLSEDHAACMELGEADAVVLSFGLLDEDRVELIRALHEYTPPVSVLVLTMSLDLVWHARALEAGAEKVLAKSASLDEIISAVVLLGLEPLAQPSAP